MSVGLAAARCIKFLLVFSSSSRPSLRRTPVKATNSREHQRRSVQAPQAQRVAFRNGWADGDAPLPWLGSGTVLVVSWALSLPRRAAASDEHLACFGRSAKEPSLYL